MAGHWRMQILDEQGNACVPDAQHDTEFPPNRRDDWSSEMSTSLPAIALLYHKAGTVPASKHGPLNEKNVFSQRRKENSEIVL